MAGTNIALQFMRCSWA